MDIRWTEKRQTLLVCLLLAALTFVAYWPVRLHEFINYDDQEYVTQNPQVARGLSWAGLSWAFRTGHSANWHPLTWLSHMLDCQLFGLNPAGHHLMNVSLHLANTILLFLVLRLATGAGGRSAFVAGLFALHPLHVESVAWVAERKDLLSTFFGLISLGAYVIYVKRKTSCYYVLSLLFFAFSLMSKPMLVTLPFVLLLLDYWPLRRLAPSTIRFQLSAIRDKLPFFALSALACAVTLHVQQAAMRYYQHLPFASRAANAIVACVRYLAKTFWPHDLAIFYPHPVEWPAGYVVAAVFLLALISILVLLNLRQRPYLGVGWFWFCGALVPVLGLVQVGVQSMADRYTYVPLIGIFIMVTWFGVEALRSVRMPDRMVPVLAGTVLLGCVVGTRAQLAHWRNTETVFTHAVSVTRNNWVAHYNLALLALSRYQENQRAGIQNQVLTANAEPLPASGADGRDYLREVIAQCEATLQIKPEFADPYVTLAKALTEHGEIESARAQLESAIRLAPQNPDAHQNFAEVLNRQGHPKEAVGEYKVALSLKPDWESVLNNLAWLLATCPEASVRDGQEAVRLAEHACTLTGRTNIWFLHTLAAAYAEAGAFTNAVAIATEAQRLAPATGQPDLATTAARRVELYRAGHPLRSP